MAQRSRSSRWDWVGSVLYGCGLIALGFVLALGLIIGGGAFVVNRALREANQNLPAPLPTSTAIPIAATTPTPPPPPPDATPAPIPPPSPSRYDVEVRISQQYVNYQAQREFAQTDLGIGIQSVSFAIQSGNVFTLYILPIGSRDFYLTFTGQLIPANNQIAVVPLSSSLLLTPFRGQIAQQMQDGINQRLAQYRQSTPYTITSFTTTSDGDIVATLVFPR